MSLLEDSFKKLNIEEKTYSVLSIDIGVINLGISCSLVTESFELLEIIWIDLLNITEYTHKVVSKNDCKLHHTKTFSDWLEHVYQENYDFFNKADFILIERQPPGGFTVIEQLIFNKWRNKSYLINPVNIHCFAHIKHLNYDQRKLATEEIAKTVIKEENLLQQFYFYDRRHDIADSICMMLYWIDKKHKDQKKETQQKIIKDKFDNLIIQGVSAEKWLNQFNYEK